MTPPAAPPSKADAEATDAVLLRFAECHFVAPSQPDHIGVAVSGGSDSTALLHLFHRAHPGKVLAVTVDHGLRPESAAEAAGVSAFCAALGIPHTIVRWQGPQPTGNLMDQARRARLSLMAAWAKSCDVSHMVLGHTADDQAETVLMNLARAAGLDGLTGMRDSWTEHGIKWSRPFLHICREDLRGYLRRQGLAWIDDPSNDNDRFSRVKARKALRALAPLGITVEKLSETASHLADARQALNYAIFELAEAVVTERAGGLTIARKSYRRLMPDMQRRLLLAMIGWMGGSSYPPRSAALFRLEMALGQSKAATLGGVRFRHQGDHILVTREARAVQGSVPMGQLWDHRWQLVGPVLEGAEIAALGVDGLQECPDWRSLAPRDVLLTSPALRQNGRLVAAPLAGKTGEYRAKLAPDLTQFILSH